MGEEETNEVLIDRQDAGAATRGRLKGPVPLWLSLVLIVLVLSSVGLVVTWVSKYMGEDALAMDNSNWHFIYMILFVSFTTLGTLSFRLLTGISRLAAKIVHAMSLTSALIVAAVGLNYKWKGLGYMYSLHSWLGFGFVLIFGVQWLIGVVSFLLSTVPGPTRAKIVPYHRAIGTIITVGVVCVAVAGINEKMIFKAADYKLKGGETMVANFLGLAVAIGGSIAAYIQIMPDLKRPEERRNEIIQS